MANDAHAHIIVFSKKTTVDIKSSSLLLIPHHMADDQKTHKKSITDHQHVLTTVLSLIYSGQLMANQSSNFLEIACFIR
jgi:hypothetical protein